MNVPQTMVNKAKSVEANSSRLTAVILAVVFLGLAYILGSRALDTGSWWEYSGTFLLVILALNRALSLRHTPN